MKALKFFSAFAASMCVFAGVAWLGGYDFDSRGFWVAYWAAISFACSVGVASWATT